VVDTVDFLKFRFAEKKRVYCGCDCRNGRPWPGGNGCGKFAGDQRGQRV